MCARSRPLARNTSSRVITNLHRTAGLPCQCQRQRLQVDYRLAAEAAADLGPPDPDLGYVPAEQAGAVSAHDPVALRGHPQLASPSSDTLAMQACGSI